MKIKYKRKQIGCINVPSGKRPEIKGRGGKESN